MFAGLAWPAVNKRACFVEHAATQPPGLSKKLYAMRKSILPEEVVYLLAL